jgi:hypothetical protein
VIHYHGGPITPLSAALATWKGRHAFVSFAYPDQIALAAEVCQSFALDNGAYTHWKQGGGRVDVKAYVAWVKEWRQHPGFDWALIPDVVDGTEADNDAIMAHYREAGGDLLGDVPVWHMHESTERLRRLCHAFRRVALGSSGSFPNPGTADWWQRMGEAMSAVTDGDGRPRTKLHGLRMLDPTICSHLPLASADSTNVARNVGVDGKWRGGAYTPLTKAARALVLVDRIENHASAARWTGSGGVQKNLELVG